MKVFFLVGIAGSFLALLGLALYFEAFYKPAELLGKGGDGGKIVIIAREIRGNGSFNANGGSGSTGGEGGEVSLISDKNEFTGTISTKGGGSILRTAQGFAVKHPWWFSLITGMISSIAFAILSSSWKFLKRFLAPSEGIEPPSTA